MAITRRQKEVIDFLSNFTNSHGYSPSYEEIAAGLGLNSLATVHKHVTNLQTKGLLQRAHNRSRSIDVIPQRKGRAAMDRLPLMGRIAAGQPVEAVEQALVDGTDATLKRFYREGEFIRLQPSNAEMGPIYAPAANVAIQGKVLGILRKYA